MEPEEAINVIDGPLKQCSADPITGFFRDGHCNTCARTGQPYGLRGDDGGVSGLFEICRQRPEHAAAEFRFPGLKPGDSWCLCASRFLQAHDEGCAPNVHLEATHKRALDVVPLEVLRTYATKA